MLLSLSVKNVALITKTEMEFCGGLNIITGETGAGKSMFADCLNFILGQRPNKDFVRAGEESAEVECVIEAAEANKEKILEYGIDVDCDNLLVIKRNMTDSGKSLCKINGKTVSVGMLKDIAKLLFDMHGQHEHQSLLEAGRHISILDKFCGTDADMHKSELGVILKELRSAEAEIASISGDNSNREALLDLYSFQIKEIENANLKAGEDEDLLTRRKILNNSEEIAGKAKAAVKAISGGDSGASALDLATVGSKALNRLAALDPSCMAFAENLEKIIVQLDDLSRDLRAYKSGISHDQRELNSIEDRLDLIYNLKRKYGRTVDDILLFLEKTTEKYESLLNSSERLEALNKKHEELRQKADIICAKISALRKKAAGAISREIEKNLRELEMKDAMFSVLIERRDDFSLNGYDKVEFLISANAGEELKPLAQIASGGEISRVMLALKTVLVSADTIETLVFDEIDTGVSGRTAQKVAEKLSYLSGTSQILCITHLPQIAAMADRHFLVEKVSDGEKTTTTAITLDEEQIKAELARLIGGAEITEATLAAAGELREMAKHSSREPK